MLCRLGKFLSKYTNGSMPKGFKFIPSLSNWEDVLYLTEPEHWSPNAMYQATRVFSSNLGVKKAERFYKLVLLPRVREDIRKNKRLHFALYQALKKSIYKPAAFFKGILFTLCEVIYDEPVTLNQVPECKKYCCRFDAISFSWFIFLYSLPVRNMQFEGSCYYRKYLAENFNSYSSFKVGLRSWIFVLTVVDKSYLCCCWLYLVSRSY